MKIAIHTKTGKFSSHWIKYCEANHIDFKSVDVFDTDIISKIEDCDALMWHFAHQHHKDKLFALSILFAIQASGKLVFPDINTSWHYDDKVAQKYLLEAIHAPLIKSYVYTDKEIALDWAEKTCYPKIFKLRGGAGSTNVKLVANKIHAKKIINIAFSNGFSQIRRDEKLKSSVKSLLQKKGSLLQVIKNAYYLAFGFKDNLTKYIGKEAGYVYFQDFIDNNDFDTRLIVINGNKAYGMQRYVRDGDFRASGSENFKYDPIPRSILEIGFNVAKRLKLQSVAFDFIFDNGRPKIIELSYGFGTLGSSQCKGYWDDKFVWHETDFNPMGWMVEDLMTNLRKQV